MEDTSLDSDLSRFVDTLVEKTKAGKLDWQPTARADTFIVSVGGGGNLLQLTCKLAWELSKAPNRVEDLVLYVFDKRDQLAVPRLDHGRYPKLQNLYDLVSGKDFAAEKARSKVAELTETIQKL